MGTHVIMIYATKDKPFPLSIGDDEKHLANTTPEDKAFITEVNNGDTVIWSINPKSDIQSIDNIQFTDSFDFMKTPPTLMADGSKNWTCQIQLNKGTLRGMSEYKITYKVNGVPFIQDPRLRIKQ